MTQTIAQCRSLRAARQDRCIAALAVHSNVRRALRETDIAASTYYRWRKRDTAFRARCAGILGEPVGQVARVVTWGSNAPHVIMADVRHDSISAAQKNAFFETLAETSNVAESARKAKFSTSSAYRLRRNDAAFRAGFDAALADGYDHLELNLLERARFGVPQEKPGTGRKFNDTFGLRLLEVHRKAALTQRSHEAAVAGEIPRMTLKAAIARILARLERVGVPV